MFEEGVFASPGAVAEVFAAAGIDLEGVDLALLRPRAATASPLAWLDPDRSDLTDNALIEMCLMASRLEAWAGAVKARAAVGLCRAYEAHDLLLAADRELAATDPARGNRPGHDPYLATSMATVEIGCATAHSQSQVETWVRLARWLDQVPTARVDFASGRLGWSKAAAFWDCAANYTAEQAETVYLAERHRALVRTSSQIRVRWNRALAKADPEVMRRQAEAAHAEREVKVLSRCSAPGTASLLLTGPAPLILAAKQRLDDVADWVRAADPGDSRSLGAIRLDAALDLLLRGHLSDAEPGGRTGGGRASGQTGQTGPTGSGSGRASGPTGSGRASGPTGSGSGRASGPTGSDGSRPPGFGDSGTTPWPSSGQAPARRRPAVVVTIPLSVLTGSGQMPAALAGYGPIPAQMAREVAADAVWRCAVLDDDPTSATHGALVALGRTTYTPNYVPGEQARRFITIRDGTCRFPGCQAQAATGDLDHRTPHNRGGPTCDCNLQALCRHHHRLKHEGGITVKRGRVAREDASDGSVRGDASDGTVRDGTPRGGVTERPDHPDAITWTMPSGRSYTTMPEAPPF